MQFIAETMSGKQIVVILMFENSDDPTMTNDFLNHLEFGKGRVKKMENGFKETVGIIRLNGNIMMHSRP